MADAEHEPMQFRLKWALAGLTAASVWLAAMNSPRLQGFGAIISLAALVITSGFLVRFFHQAMERIVLRGWSPICSGLLSATLAGLFSLLYAKLLTDACRFAFSFEGGGRSINVAIFASILFGAIAWIVVCLFVVMGLYELCADLLAGLFHRKWQVLSLALVTHVIATSLGAMLYATYYALVAALAESLAGMIDTADPTFQTVTLFGAVIGFSFGSWGFHKHMRYRERLKEEA